MTEGASKCSWYGQDDPLYTIGALHGPPPHSLPFFSEHSLDLCLSLCFLLFFDLCFDFFTFPPLIDDRMANEHV